MPSLSLAVLLACGALLSACARPARGALEAVDTAPVEEEPAAIGEPAPGDASWLRRGKTLRPVFDAAADHRFEVLVSVPDPSAARWLVREELRVDEEYFYPASAIKLAIAVAALEKVSEGREAGDGVDAHTPLVRDRPAPRAPGRLVGDTSIASVVDRALVVSDNAASNLLFDFVGSDELHERLWRIGLPTVRVRHRLGGDRYDPGCETPALSLLRTGAPPLRIPSRRGRLALGANDDALVGDSFVSRGKLRREPMSFAQRNRIGLRDLQELLVAVVRPDLREPRVAARLGEEERALLLSSLEARPSLRGGTVEDDVRHEPLLPGLERVVPAESLLVASKGGRAYGFVVENAFVVDLRTQRSFFLTAVVYANENRRLNDDAYDYERVAAPLFADLGEVVADRVFGAAAGVGGRP